MAELIARKVRVKCDIRGCRNIKDVYSVSNSKEAGNTPKICAVCASKIMDAINIAKTTEIPVAEVKKSDSLFFGACGEGESTVELTKSGIEEPEDSNADLICQYCGKVCASSVGLASHERACKKKLEGGE